MLHGQLHKRGDRVPGKINKLHKCYWFYTSHYAFSSQTLLTGSNPMVQPPTDGHLGISRCGPWVLKLLSWYYNSASEICMLE